MNNDKKQLGKNGVALPSGETADVSAEVTATVIGVDFDEAILNQALRKSERYQFTTPSQTIFREALLPVLQDLSNELNQRIVLQEEVLVAHSRFAHHPDFFLPGGRLAIEVDGPVHDGYQQMEIDGRFHLN